MVGAPFPQGLLLGLSAKPRGGLADRGQELFPRGCHVAVLRPRDANAHPGFSIGQPSIQEPYPDRLFEYLADNSDPFPMPISVMSEFMLSLSVAMSGLRVPKTRFSIRWNSEFRFRSRTTKGCFAKASSGTAFNLVNGCLGAMATKNG
jgi:hypothetical protein